MKPTYEKIDDIYIPITLCLNCKEPVRNMDNNHHEYCNDECEDEFHEVMNYILEGD